MTTAATLLARGKMTDIEDGILENGFSTDDETDKGTFREQGFPGFRWESLIERIELPTDMKQLAEQQSTDTSKSSDPMQALTGMMGGLMSSFMEPIRVGLQESVRRVTVKVFWDEVGRRDLRLRGGDVPDRPRQAGGGDEPERRRPEHGRLPPRARPAARPARRRPASATPGVGR